MTYRIHYTLPDGTEDSVVIHGDSLEELQAQARTEVSRRDATNPWSEELS